MSCIGVNIGALTVKVTALRRETRNATVLAHQGRPLEILKEVLARPEFADAEYFGVSGQLGSISEVAAVQRALREVEGTFDAVASLGGESFLVYLLIDGRITPLVARQHVQQSHRVVGESGVLAETRTFDRRCDA